MTTAAPAALATPPARALWASPWPVFWIASSAVFLVSLDATMLFAAFDALRQSFAGSSAAALSWVLNAYTVVYAAMLIPAGGLADAHGRKRVFQIGLAVFIAASAACGAAPTVGWLIAARVLQALGAALLTPASMAIVLGAFPAERRAVVISLWGAVGGLAAAVGPSLGSAITAYAGWSWAFYINVPVGLWALWRGRTRLQVAIKPAERRPVDLVGLGLLMTAVGAVALAIVESGSPTWSAGRIAAVAGGGLAAGGAFIAWARIHPAPLLDLSLFALPTYRYVNAATLSFGTAFAMMFLGFFFFMTGVWHYSLPQAGLAVTPGPLLVMPTAIVTGRLAARLGHRPFLVGGLAAVCRQRPVADAGARPAARLPAPLAAGPADERRGRGSGAALAGRRRGEPPARGPLRGGRRLQPGHPADRQRAGRGDHGGPAGPRGLEPRGLPHPVRAACGAGPAHRRAVPAGQHAPALNPPPPTLTRRPG